jgi:hypothetical protein
MHHKFFGALAAILASALIVSCQDITGANAASGVPGVQLSAAVKANAIFITDQAGLAAIEKNPADNYVLGASFSVTDWVPICGPTSPNGPFTGTLDGAGYTITIDSFDLSQVTDYLGIFQQAQRALFTGLTVDIAAGAIGPVSAQYVGGLVAEALNTTFDGITVTGVLDISIRTETDFNVGLVAGYAARTSAFIDTTINADLNALYSSRSTTSVNAGGIAGYLADSTLLGANIDGRFAVNANMPYDYTPDNGVTLGGAAGYAENTRIVNVTVDAKTVANAVSAQTPVYVAGVVGRGLNISIQGNKSAAFVSGNGPNYNTSAGGVAGYIVQSSVDNSSATGNVTLSATWDGGEYSLWQIYAGGLVGYSGGNLNGNSVIISSGASGNVSANAPYPYAGGLVGYNYGYNDFTSAEERWQFYHGKTTGLTVTYNGGLITRSYATGNATATSTPGSNGLPYAGGLAGYSSIPTVNGDPNIENCYATGNATVTTDSKYGWAGGLLGANAQGSRVVTSYASGDVFVTVGSNELAYSQPGINPGAAGGGIVGVNYYVDVTSGLPAVIEDSVALNGHITGSAPYGIPYLLHRVAGDLGEDTSAYLGTLIDNDAISTIVISPVWDPEIGPDRRDGASIGPGQAAFAGWDFANVWTTDANGYPVLR